MIYFHERLNTQQLLNSMDKIGKYKYFNWFYKQRFKSFFKLSKSSILGIANALIFGDIGILEDPTRNMSGGRTSIGVLMLLLVEPDAVWMVH